MTSWAIVALVAIIVWGVVEFAKARAGIITDENGNETIAPREDGRSAAELEAARRELAELRERVKVLERIATDSNSGDAREQARIAAEIEALRDLPANRKEQSE
jgi:cell division protein FtsB